MTTVEKTIEGFLQDIVSHPEDHSIWLILADYLEDCEDPRGELVRLTWELSYDQEHCEFGRRQDRLQELLLQGVEPVRPRRLLNETWFVWIPPGEFNMGSEAKYLKYADETLHPVTISKGFWMSQLPFCTQPGVVDSFTDMQEAENVVRVLGGDTVLPTEAEWEYACRAGTRTRWNFGNSCKRELVVPAVNLDTEKVEIPAGFFPPNAWGLHHMHGLIWEPCQDYYLADLSQVQQVDPCILSNYRHHGVISDRRYRVIRGGPYYQFHHQINAVTGCGRSAGRFALVHRAHLGLRLVYRGQDD